MVQDSRLTLVAGGARPCQVPNSLLTLVAIPMWLILGLDSGAKPGVRQQVDQCSGSMVLNPGLNL